MYFSSAVKIANSTKHLISAGNQPF